MAFRPLHLALGGIVLIALVGCDKQPEQQATKLRDTTATAASSDISSSSAELLRALNTPALAGGDLVAAVDVLSLKIKPNESGKVDTRIRNEGDTPVTISSVDTAILNEGISIGAQGCTPGLVLQPQAFCDLFVTYKDSSGRGVDNALILVSDARKTPTLKIPFRVDVEEENKAPPAVDEAAPDAVSHIRPSNIPYDEISAINSLRHRVNWGTSAKMGEVRQRTVSYETKYPDSEFPATEASLPIDRRRVLGPDRVIKAVLETPFSNIMCSKIVAKTDTDTWGANQFPGRDAPLLPAGTTFIGTCNAFTDERAGVAWTRFITPDGRSAVIKGVANDAMGNGGLPGILDRRWFDKYGIPILFSGVRSMAQYALTRGEEATSTVTNPELGVTTSTETPAGKAIDKFQSDMDQILGNVENDLKETQEVLTVPAGTRIDIMMMQDIYFKDPYTVVSLGDDEYTLPDKQRQALYRTPPKPLVAAAEDGAAQPAASSQIITIGTQSFYISPVPVATNQNGERPSPQVQAISQQNASQSRYQGNTNSYQGGYSMNGGSGEAGVSNQNQYLGQ